MSTTQPELSQMLVAVGANGKDRLCLSARGELLAHAVVGSEGIPSGLPMTPGLWHGEGLYGLDYEYRDRNCFYGKWSWRRPTALDDRPVLRAVLPGKELRLLHETDWWYHGRPDIVEDIGRIVRACRARGYEVSATTAEDAWACVSGDVEATWLVLPESDEAVFQEVLARCYVFDRDAAGKNTAALKKARALRKEPLR